MLSVFYTLPAFSGLGLFHVLLGVGTVWGVLRLGELSGLDPRATLAGALMVAIDPILVNQSVQLMSETLAAFLAMWTLVALARLHREPSVPRSVIAGALAALAALCRPTFLVWLLVVAVVLPFRLPTSRSRALALTAVFLLEAFAVIAPWPLRNLARFGTPIVTTTHGGYTLLLGNNPSFYEYLRSGSWGSVWNANDFHSQWQAELRKRAQGDCAASPLPARPLAADESRAGGRDVRARGRPTRLRSCLAGNSRRAGMFGYACLVRVGRLWSVLPHQLSEAESTSRRGLRYAVAVWYTAQFALAIVGAWSLGRKWLASPWVWSLLLVATFTAVHTVYWTDMRMRTPLVGVVCLLAAVGGAQLASKKRAATPLLDAT